MEGGATCLLAVTSVAAAVPSEQVCGHSSIQGGGQRGGQSCAWIARLRKVRLCPDLFWPGCREATYPTWARHLESPSLRAGWARPCLGDELNLIAPVGVLRLALSVLFQPPSSWTSSYSFGIAHGPGLVLE